MNALIARVTALLQKAGISVNQTKLNALTHSPQTVRGQAIYATAKSLLGQTLAENSLLGCAETVNSIVNHALGFPVGGGASTALMFEALKDTKHWTPVQTPLPGDIIISPTGHGNGRLAHGHVGIVGQFGILSNNSEDGKLEEKYTLKTWHDLYAGIGGFPVCYFRALD